MLFILAACSGGNGSQSGENPAESSPAPATGAPSATRTPSPEPAATEALSPASELMAFYPFDGNVEDASGNGNHGLVEGATLIADRFGNPDSAYQFDGVDDIIKIAPDRSLNLTLEGTISLWLQYEAQASESYYTLVEKSDPDRGGHARYGLWIIGDRAEFCVDSASAGFQQCLDAEAALQPGQWHHIVGVTDGSSLTMYIDGQPAGALSYPRDTISVSGFELFMGADLYNSQVIYLTGALDDIRIYRRALSADEVRQLFVDTS